MSEFFSQQDLINFLVQKERLRNPQIIKAFQKIDRKNFLPENQKKEAYLDQPLPIGFNQTISQPSTVAFMLELLAPQEKEKILDVGSGSGWQTALLAEIVGEQGKVYAIEIIPQLKEFGQRNIEKLKYKNVKIFCQDGSKGLPEYAPFDKIIVAASAEKKIPQALLDQLRINGRLVLPIGGIYEIQEILLIEKETDEKYKEKSFYGFRFVPLVGKG